MHTDALSPVVLQLDMQILGCVLDEQLSDRQQGELLRWVHSHLISAYVAMQFDKRFDGTVDLALKRLVHPCLTNISMIGQMIQGGVPLEPDLTFHCPPSGCPRSLALARKLPAWLQRRVVLAAQRTRLHTQAELKALWKAIKIHLITGALAWFELDDLLEVELPAAETLHIITRDYLEAVYKVRGLAWTPAGVVLRA